MKNFKRILTQCIQHQQQWDISITTMIIQAKAKIFLRTWMLLIPIWSAIFRCQCWVVWTFARAPWIPHREASMRPITVAARSNTWTVFAHSNAGILGSNPTQGMDVCICVRLFCVYVVLFAGSGLATGWSPIQEDLPTVYWIRELKKWPRPKKGL
jgi:hypothetical protein